MVKKLIRKFWCLRGDHDWTCATLEEIKPTPLQLKTGWEGLKDYAKVYCKHCKKLSNLQLY